MESSDTDSDTIPSASSLTDYRTHRSAVDNAYARGGSSGRCPSRDVGPVERSLALDHRIIFSLSCTGNAARNDGIRWLS